jgi:DNA polymerase-3 subunit alpha
LTIENSHSYNIEGVSVHNSAAGSLLSWCLDITQIDSLHFDLYFERFLNPARKGAPDIDIDFEGGTDELTLNFLYEKYGKHRVVPVVTFGTFSEKGTVKDVIRALGGDTSFGSDVEAVTKEMPSMPTWNISLEKWFETYPHSPECSERVRNLIMETYYRYILGKVMNGLKTNRVVLIEIYYYLSII